MKKTKVLVCTLAAALMMTGCQESEVKRSGEKVEAEVKTETQKEEKVEKVEEVKAPSLSKEEVSELIFTTLETIQTALDEAWDENNWNSSAEADLNVFKEKLKNVTSEEFVDTEINQMMNSNYYEGTDIKYIPFSLRTDIKLDIEQDGQTIRATSFVPAELFKSGEIYTFTFNYIDSKWVLQGWTTDAITNLGLTVEESQQVLESIFPGSTIAFLEERNIDGVTDFVFTLGDTGTVIINPNTTEYLDEYMKVVPEETIERDPMSEWCPDPEEEIAKNVDYNKLDAKAEEIVNGFRREEASPGTIKSSSYYGSLLYEIQEYMNGVDGYKEQEYGKWEGQYPFNKAEYILVDRVLNEMWAILKKDLDPSEFAVLKEEQKQWLQEVTVDAEKAEKEEANELQGKCYYYSFLHGDTVERCREFVNQYFQYEYDY